MSEYDAGADYINCAMARESRRGAAAVKRMIGEKTASRFITAGWIVAGFSGLLTGFLAYQSAANLNPLNFIDAALLLALAYGIFRKSRVCAVLALGYYVASQILIVTILHGTATLTGLVGAAFFVAAYALSIIGTFAWHRGARTGPAGPTATPAEQSR